MLAPLFSLTTSLGCYLEPFGFFRHSLTTALICVASFAVYEQALGMEYAAPEELNSTYMFSRLV